MNILNTNLLGGHPLTLDDFSFLQEANRDGFKAISNMLADVNTPGFEPSYIIKGCVKSLQSAGVWQISEGYVFLNGEVCHVPQHTVSFSDESDPLYWSIVQTSVEPSPVEYRDLQLQEVHLQRIAKVSTIISDLLFENILSVRALLDRRLRRQFGNLTVTNGWEGTVQYTIAHGRIHLHGYLSATSNTVHALSAFDIPSSLTPWGWGFEDYVGVKPAIGSTEAGILALAYGLYGGISFPTIRLYKSDSSITSTSCWPCHIMPINMTSAAPRIAKFMVFNPQNIPSGSDRVVYNLSGISWDLPSE